MKRGFLLMNTGSPDAPTEAALRVYLEQFLMDKYVIDLPFPLRYAIVHWAILPKRPAQSAEAYEAIWTEHGSPLIHYCSNLVNGLKTKFDEPTEMIMAYGHPSIDHGVGKLLENSVDEICLLPMFPQYAMATVGSCVAGVKGELKRRKSSAKLRVVPPFYNEPSYIKPIAESLKNVDEHILFSYHGLPVRHLKKTDPTHHHCMSSPTCCNEPSIAHDTCYRFQCLATTRAITEAAKIPDNRYHISFQSRLGRAQWMEPYTEETLRNLPSVGITKLAVVCPAFFCDCLETLEEIEIRGKETFLEAGGGSYRMIPCLNDSASAFRCLETLMSRADRWVTT